MSRWRIWRMRRIEYEGGCNIGFSSSFLAHCPSLGGTTSFTGAVDLRGTRTFFLA